MVDEKNKVEEKKDVTEDKEQKIQALKDQIKSIKYEGQFSGFYNNVRKNTVLINKEDITDKEKRVKLSKLLEKNLLELKKYI